MLFFRIISNFYQSFAHPCVVHPDDNFERSHQLLFQRTFDFVNIKSICGDQAIRVQEV